MTNPEMQDSQKFLLTVPSVPIVPPASWLYSMKPIPKKPQTRWRVSAETAAGMDRVRKLYGHKSWDEFFQAIVQQRDYKPEPTPARLEAIDLKYMLTKLDSIRDLEFKILSRLDDREETYRAIQEELDLTNKHLARLKALMEIALQEDPESSETKPKESSGSKKAETLKKFMEGKG